MNVEIKYTSKMGDSETYYANQRKKTYYFYREYLPSFKIDLMKMFYNNVKNSISHDPVYWFTDPLLRLNENWIVDENIIKNKEKEHFDSSVIIYNAMENIKVREIYVMCNLFAVDESMKILFSTNYVDGINMVAAVKVV